MEKEKVDYRKMYHDLYSASATNVHELVIPALQFAMIDGKGKPETSQEFQSAIQALYGVSYTLKFGRKKAGLGPDYTIGPLEGLWWMKGGEDFDDTRPDDWRWTLMILQPDFISQEDFAKAVLELRTKKPNPALDSMILATIDEGKAVQVMHIGPYDQEGPTIQRLQDYARTHDQSSRGKHHEIYLGNPSRSKPEKLRTILRHPVG